MCPHSSHDHYDRYYYYYYWYISYTLLCFIDAVFLLIVKLHILKRRLTVYSGSADFFEVTRFMRLSLKSLYSFSSLIQGNVSPLEKSQNVQFFFWVCCKRQKKKLQSNFLYRQPFCVHSKQQSSSQTTFQHQNSSRFSYNLKILLIIPSMVQIEKQRRTGTQVSGSSAAILDS